MQSSLVPCVQTGPAVELGEIIGFHSKSPFQAIDTDAIRDAIGGTMAIVSRCSHDGTCYTNAKINSMTDDWLHALLHVLRNDIHMKTISSY